MLLNASRSDVVAMFSTNSVLRFLWMCYSSDFCTLPDPLKNGATKEMIAAQGLGTVLRLARKLGPVIGKVVVVVGQGQNGLIATRLMSQFAAKAVIAIDPVSPTKMLQIASFTPLGSSPYTLHPFLSSDAT